MNACTACRGRSNRSIPPKKLHIVGLKLTIHGHDRNPFDHGLGDDQAVKRVSVVVREAGNMERVEVLYRESRNRISRQPLWNEIFRRLWQSEFP